MLLHVIVDPTGLKSTANLMRTSHIQQVSIWINLSEEKTGEFGVRGAC